MGHVTLTVNLLFLVSERAAKCIKYLYKLILILPVKKSSGHSLLVQSKDNLVSDTSS